MDLENRNAALTEEISSAPRRGGSASQADWVPRVPAAYTLTGHRSQVRKVFLEFLSFSWGFWFRDGRGLSSSCGWMGRSEEKTVWDMEEKSQRLLWILPLFIYSITLVSLIAWGHTLFSCLVLDPPDECNAHQLSGVGGAGSRSGQWGGLKLPRLANWKHYVGLGRPAWAG